MSAGGVTGGDPIPTAAVLAIEPVASAAADPDGPAAPALCPSCAAPCRPGGVFCGRCGAGLTGGLAARTRTGFADAVWREAAAGRAPRTGEAGLGLALVAYFLCLGAILAVSLSDGGPAELRAATLLILAVGVFGAAVARRAVLPTLWRRPRVTARGALIVLAVTAVAYGLAMLMMQLQGLGDLDAVYLLEYQLAGLPLGLALADIALLTAVAEELVFRGVILSGLETSFGRRRAVAVSAALFATLHVSPVAFPHLLLLGWLLAEVRLRSGSLWPCVLVHAGYNAVVVVASWP